MASLFLKKLLATGLSSYWLSSFILLSSSDPCEFSRDFFLPKSNWSLISAESPIVLGSGLVGAFKPSIKSLSFFLKIPKLFS